MALDTSQDYVTEARTLIQDTLLPYRYDAASLVSALNMAMLAARRERADLFLLSDTTPVFDAADDTSVPIEEQFRLAVLFLMAAHVLWRDQEDIQDAKAAAYASAAKSILTGSGYAPVQKPTG